MALRTQKHTTDEFGLMPYLSEDGSQECLHIFSVDRYYGLNKKLENDPAETGRCVKGHGGVVYGGRNLRPFIRMASLKASTPAISRMQRRMIPIYGRYCRCDQCRKYEHRLFIPAGKIRLVTTGTKMLEYHAG